MKAPEKVVERRVVQKTNQRRMRNAEGRKPTASTIPGKLANMVDANTR